ncbi:MAG: hypothetical protein ACYTBJ_22270, partial [Planctomycetota bacterium]
MIEYNFGGLANDRNDFEFLLPPGQFRLSAHAAGIGPLGPTDHVTTENIEFTIEVKPGQTTLDLGNIELPPTKTTRLFGKPAPELEGIREWKNGRTAKLADLRGNVVLLHFCNSDRDLADMRRLLTFYQAYPELDVQYLVIHNGSIDSLTQMDARIQAHPELANMANQCWRPDDSPFRIALDTKGPLKTLKGKTYTEGRNWANYGLDVYPRTFLVDKQGILRKPCSLLSSPEGLRFEDILEQLRPFLSLKPGDPLRELSELNIEPIPENIKDRMLLLCFFDIDQRPSRHLVSQLAKRAEQLKRNGVAVLAVQAARVDEKALNDWVEKSRTPFPVGMLRAEESKIRFNWGVRSLPWLILADADHLVTAEGFDVDDLDKKTDQLSNAGQKRIATAKSSASSALVKCVGKVVDNGGNLLGGVNVSAYKIASDGIAGNVQLIEIGRIITKSDGAFAFKTEPKPEKPTVIFEAIIVAEKEGLALGWVSWEMLTDARLRIQLAEPEQLAGVIVDGHGVAVAHAEVRAVLFEKKTSEKDKTTWLPGLKPLQSLASTTDDKGRFHFNKIPTDTRADLLVSAAGYSTTYTRKPEAASGYEGATFPPGQTNIRVVLVPEARIEGRIIDRTTGQGLPGVNLAVVPTFSPLFFYRFVCVSDENGAFDIGGLQTGEYLIRGDFPRTWVQVKSGTTTENIIIEHAGLLTGRVTDPNGEPLANVEIQVRGGVGAGRLSDTHAGAKTDEQGYYRTADLGGPCRVGFLWDEQLPARRGRRSQYKRLAKPLEGSQAVNFQFEQFPKGTAALTVRAVDQDGRPVTDFAVDIRNKVEWEDYSKDLYQYVYQLPVQAPESTLELSNLPAGVYWVRTYEPHEWRGYQFPERQQVTLDHGRTGQVTQKVIKKLPCYGRILFEDGSPAVPELLWSGPRQEVSVSSPFDSHDSRVDKQGHFTVYLTDDELEQIKAGAGKLGIFYPSYRDPGHSYPIGVFPVDLLARQKDKAGALKISKPIHRPAIDLTKAPSLAGKPLPALEGISIELIPAQKEKKPLLVCFWDMQQRPSRHVVRELTKRAGEMKEKGVVVVAVQA